MRIILIIVVFILIGCATPQHEFKDGYYWYSERQWEPINKEDWRYIVVDEPKNVCMKYFGILVDACVVTMMENGKRVCNIYISPTVSDKLLAHEERHCDGWQHW